MMTETGRVVAVESDAIWVETIRQSTCGSCSAQKGCGHGLINSISDGNRSLIRVMAGKLPLDACAVDDQVRFSIPEEVILRGSMVVYIMPLVCMLLGALAAVNIFNGSQDLLAACGTVVGFAIGFLAVRLHAWRHRDDRTLQPTLIEVVGNSAQALQLH